MYVSSTGIRLCQRVTSTICFCRELPGLAWACENSAVGAKVDGECGGVIQQVHLALRALFDYELLPADAAGLPHEHLQGSQVEEVRRYRGLQ